MANPFVAHIDERQANFARREITGSQTETTVEPSQEEVFAACEKCSEVPGPFESWSEKAERTLVAAIPLRHRVDKYPATLEALCAQPWMQDRKRLLSSSKLDLACIYACVKAPTTEIRRSCSRFSKVLRAAVAAGVTPDGVAVWLKTVTLTSIVKGGAKRRPSANIAIQLSRAEYPLLAAALADDATLSAHPELKAMVGEAAARCEEALRRVVGSRSSRSEEPA